MREICKAKTSECSNDRTSMGGKQDRRCMVGGEGTEVCYETKRAAFLPRLLKAGWSSSTNVSRTEEESVSEVHDNEHDIVGRGVGVGDCLFMGR